ncbi:hypothetical protein CEXT_363541 [Caerostris extrusa]|uniref:Uncharacterized protein n=1 Tax=Caerostris extrusa TaxID=172846 RepID=A0AAV4SUI6_CAEEX|nr:hypothetical protein CEXT_363541 [Caerostris extrusa]
MQGILWLKLLTDAFSMKISLNSCQMRSLADDTDYLIIVSNFPKNMKNKQIRSALSSRLKSVNCRVKNINEVSAEIVLPDDCARDKRYNF